MLDTLKNTKTYKGVTVEEFLKEKHPNGKWVSEENLLIYEVPVQHLVMQYTWKLNGDKLESVSGRAHDLTPSLDVRLQEINSRKKLLDPKELEIFERIQKYNEELDVEESAQKVSEETGLDMETIQDIYDRVSRAIYLGR